MYFCYSPHSLFSLESARAVKLQLMCRFAIMLLTPCSALKVQEPYIKYKTPDATLFTRGFIIV